VGDSEVQLRTELSKLEREYAEKQAIYKPDWPAMQQLRAQIERTRQHLDNSVASTARKTREIAHNDYLTALRREQSLRLVLQGQRSEAMSLNSSAVGYTNLKVEVDTKRALLDKLLEQQAQTEVSSRLRGQGVSTVQIVERALPPGVRFRPSYRRNALNALFFGALIGIGLAFLLEYLDRSLRTPEQVEQALNLPALGVIPAIGSPAHHGYGRYAYGLRRKRAAANEDETHSVDLLPHTHPRTSGAEAYRAFRTALLLSRAGGVKSIVITSSLPGEGKTSTAINLAIVLGQLGKKVLLLDADLHKPRLHELLRLSNRAGLVSILAENANPQDVIARTDLPGVVAVTSGPSSPNPSGLLSSEAMSRLMEYATRSFDFVVIDTPPISMVADAILIGHQADGVVLCVHGGSTAREQVARVRDKLLRANVRVLGVLINRLEEDPTGYGKYYHYYSEQGSEPAKATRSEIA
jgi:capsular exopolysaccharide synthesis family protein